MRTLQYALQRGAPLVQGPVPNIFAVGLQKVIGEERSRCLPEHARCQGFAADARLQRAERERAIALPTQYLAVENRAVRKSCSGRCDLRKALGDQIIAAGPQKRLAAAPNELSTNPVPFPFGLPG